MTSADEQRWCKCPTRKVERRCRCRECGCWVPLTPRQDALLLLALTHFFRDGDGDEDRQRLRRRRGRKRPDTAMGRMS
jgi:hypothetical protein